jgi:hypothetical protein
MHQTERIGVITDAHANLPDGYNRLTRRLLRGRWRQLRMVRGEAQIPCNDGLFDPIPNRFAF